MGDRLDEALFRRLSGDVPLRRQEAILIATIDERGRPHPALLSYGEVLAVTPAALRLAVSAESTTARNLAERGALTLCLIGPDGAAYVKTAAQPLPAEPSLSAQGLAAFEARVEEVLVDAPAAGEKAHLTSGITFTADDPDFQAQAWGTKLDALRRA
jgi:Pyridoxamine 5'-phosphate oxidase